MATETPTEGPIQEPIVLNQSTGPAPLLMPTPRKSKIFAIAVIILSLVSFIIAAVAYAQIKERSNRLNNTSTANVVVFNDDGMVPKTLRIHKGQSVIWVNATAQQRELELTGDKIIDGFGLSAPLAQGGTYIFTFDQAGTYTYNDPESPYEADAKVIVAE